MCVCSTVPATFNYHLFARLINLWPRHFLQSLPRYFRKHLNSVTKTELTSFSPNPILTCSLSISPAAPARKWVKLDCSLHSSHFHLTFKYWIHLLFFTSTTLLEAPIIYDYCDNFLYLAPINKPFSSLQLIFWAWDKNFNMGYKVLSLHSLTSAYLSSLFLNYADFL